MDAPPEREDCKPFVKVAHLMREAGVHVPEVIAQDLARGFLLLSDLGTTTYLQALDRSATPTRFSPTRSMRSIKWQLASRPGVLPPYDEALLRRELDLFPSGISGATSGSARRRAARARSSPFSRASSRASLAQPQVYVHRDYMPRNLMVSEPNPGVLDFQDAVYGPITYDVVSLFRDAFVSWPEERVLDWSVRYWERAKKAGLPVHARLRRRSTAISNGWACSATSRCSAFSRASTTATASPAISTTRRASSTTRARSPARYAELGGARCSSSTRSRAAAPRAAYSF